jgi:hypothetical protein
LDRLLYRGLEDCSWSQINTSWTRALNPAGMFFPLTLICYPIGFLPKTMHWLAPVLMPISTLGAGIALFFALRHRHSSCRLLCFAVLAAMVVRLFHGGHAFNPVQAVDGSMILPISLLLLGLAEICRKIIQHPRWRRPMVFLTSALCLVFFGLQIQVNWTWCHVTNGEQKYHGNNQGDRLIAGYRFFQHIPGNCPYGSCLFALDVVGKPPEFSIDAWGAARGNEDGIIMVSGVSPKDFIQMLEGNDYIATSLWELKASSDRVNYQDESGWVFISPSCGGIEGFRIKPASTDRFSIIVPKTCDTSSPLTVLDLR